MSETATAAPPSGLPDVNQLTSPFEVVQHLLDRAAYLNLFAVPDPDHGDRATLTAHDRDDYFGIHGGYGLDLASELHRFEADCRPAAPGRGFEVAQAVGEGAGLLRGLLLFAPDDVAWTPGRHPPATLFDPWRSQAFAVVGAEVALGGGDGFRGYALGRTFPVVVGGRPRVLAGAVGNVVEGSGRFAGLEGTFTLNGSLVDLGFRGNVACRMVDPRGRLLSERESPAPAAIPDPDPHATYVVMRGEKSDPAVRTEYGPPPGGQQVSLVTPAQMRAVRHRLTAGSGGPRVETSYGPVVAGLEATVFLDITAPPGTAESPNAFSTENVYTFVDRDGGRPGAIQADVVLGRSFGLRFPGRPEQPAMRYGGFGPIVETSGPFRGVRGLVSVNSAIGIAPHALSMLNVLQLVDPEGRFRVGGAG